MVSIWRQAPALWDMVVPFGELLRFVIDEASKGYSKECFFWKKDFLGTSACLTSVFNLFFFRRLPERAIPVNRQSRSSIGREITFEPDQR